ncbi:MAG: hypothetical protein P8Z50_04885, partial [candidate division WOR-3 bacterium]
NDFRRDWDGATERAEGHFDRKMAQQERWGGADINSFIQGIFEHEGVSLSPDFGAKDPIEFLNSLPFISVPKNMAVIAEVVVESKIQQCGQASEAMGDLIAGTELGRNITSFTVGVSVSYATGDVRTGTFVGSCVKFGLDLKYGGPAEIPIPGYPNWAPPIEINPTNAY